MEEIALLHDNKRVLKRDLKIKAFVAMLTSDDRPCTVQIKPYRGDRWFVTVLLNDERMAPPERARIIDGLDQAMAAAVAVSTKGPMALVEYGKPGMDEFAVLHQEQERIE